MTPPDNALSEPLARQLQGLKDSSWWPLLQRWQSSTTGQALMAAVDARVAAGAVVYPSAVFRALALTPLEQVRVVVLGQDPYHGPGQAEGLAFSVPQGQRCPPSLRNIFKEVHRDLGLPVRADRTSLEPWARQGVLLLNSSLTVEKGQAGSHSKLGWHVLTDEIMLALLEDSGARVFMLWGAHAQTRMPFGTENNEHPQRHLVLRSNHPSPLSALRGPEPFIGCGHFGQVNRWFQRRGLPGVDWQLPLP